jgi:hypothetical protein
MKGFDLKSAVIGFLLGVCIMLVIGAGASTVANIGRYRIAGTGNSNTCFVIDSTTGSTWVRYSQTQGISLGTPEEWNKQQVKENRSLPTR